MKKKYIQPEMHLEDCILDNLMQVQTSQGEFTPGIGTDDDFSTKDRDNTGDSSWGDLW